MEFIMNYLSQYPIVMQILVAIGLLRVINKPLMALLQSYVEYTDTPKDNELLQKIMSSYIYGKIVYIMDYLGSVKLPPKTEKK